MTSFTPWPPVTFAWVYSTETTFGPQHQRFDEDVVAVNMTHSEGNFPTCDVTIKNPYRGFVIAGGPTWAWLAKVKTGESVYTPFFFGRLIATPDNLQAEALVLKFIARSVTWLKLKQHISDLLKGYPFDPIFVDVNKRGDPDPKLEFRSAVWHFGRTAVPSPATRNLPDLQVSISDILSPEAGWLSFLETDHFYDSFNWVITQQPLKTVQIKASVSWTQYGSGRVDMQSGNVQTWTGGSIISGWPKAGTSLSGGYTVVSATAFGNAEYAASQQKNYTWENMAQTHQNGDAMTMSESWTRYNVGGYLIRYDISSQAGLVDPGASSSMTGFEDPPTGVNIPLHVQWSETMVCYWTVFTTLILDYDAARPRTENLEFLMNANLQPVFDDVGEPASVNTETVPVPGGDVGSPIIVTQSWYTLLLAGAPIAAGTYVESTPEFVGGPLYGVAVNSGGTIGTTEPVWSDVLGTIITDGSVQWAMVGGTLPTDFPTWRDVESSTISAGTVIRSQYYLPPPTDIFGHPVPAPPAGTNAFQVAINSGQTGVYSNGLNGIADINPSWPEPLFSTTVGVTTLDNQVTWLSLGTGQEANPILDIPLGINTNSRSYFPTTRGLRSIDALINMARARLRMRSRVFKMEFETAFDRGLDMSCRKGAIVYDHRLPGGVAMGKITSYSLLMDGDKGQFTCKVTAEGAAGFNADGLPNYGGSSGTGGAGSSTGTGIGGGGVGGVPGSTGGGSAGDGGNLIGGGGPLPHGIILNPTSPNPVVTPVAGVGVYALSGLFQPGVQQMVGGTLLPGA